MAEQQDTQTPDQDARERVEKIAGIRALADWLEAHPDTALPYRINVWEFTENATELATRAKALGGQWDKVETNGYFNLRREFAPGIQYDVCVAREKVCERVLVRTELVEVPDPDAPMVTVEVPDPEAKVKEVREVYAWVCPPSLLDAAEGQGRR